MDHSSLNLLILLVFISLVASNGLGIQPASHDAEKQPGDEEALNQVPCETMDGNCGECINLDHCKYMAVNGSCVGKNTSENLNITFIFKQESCPKIENLEANNQTTTTEKSSTQISTTAPLNTASTTTSTSSPPETTTTSPFTTTSTDSTTSTSSPDPTTTSTSTTTITSTTQSSTTTSPLSTTTSPVSPDGRSSRFDGWSFFGGILLAVGIASIAFVSTRYYRARTSQTSPNYNRF